jgi:phosphate starvation-inducible PhoH-like protein
LARKIANRPAKRANRPNPRVDRNDMFNDDNSPEFLSGRKKRRSSHTEQPTQSEFKSKKVDILPRNLAQEEYLESLQDDHKALVFAMGPAGTGKTLIATLFAIQELQNGNIDKIIITRPAVSVDEQHGFLPGTLIEKMAPWVIPIMDIFKEVYSVKMIEKLIEEEVIEIAPLAYMRGRTLKNAMILADEMQNATPSQMKMLLTRIGDNSRIIITGDLNQHDRGFESNGLKDFISRITRNGTSTSIAVCQFSACDVERHPVIEEVLRIYGED